MLIILVWGLWNQIGFPELADHWAITEFDFDIICEIFSHIRKVNSSWDGLFPLSLKPIQFNLAAAGCEWASPWYGLVFSHISQVPQPTAFEAICGTWLSQANLSMGWWKGGRLLGCSWLRTAEILGTRCLQVLLGCPFAQLSIFFYWIHLTCMQETICFMSRETQTVDRCL